MPDSYVQRAELLADLGRYEEAAEELAQAVAEDPGNTAAYTLLARVRLATGALAEALAAADAAVAAAPGDVEANVARGMVLADLGRVDEAAAQAERILRHGRGNGYACTSAAAILAEVRNGQVALDAAWEGVRLTPDQPRAHLVLGVVAARLGLSEVAERAYREALELDPQLTVAQAALGVVRLEQHRYASALSHLAAAEGATTSTSDRPGPLLAGLGRLIQYAAGYALVAPVLVACVAGAGSLARVWAMVLAGIGVAGLGLTYARLAVPVRERLPELMRSDRAFAVAVWAVLAAPAGLLLFAAVGSPWPLVGTLVAGTVALFATRRPLPGRS